MSEWVSGSGGRWGGVTERRIESACCMPRIGPVGDLGLRSTPERERGILDIVDTVVPAGVV